MLKKSNNTKRYPRCESWDYIATSQEDNELDRLNNLRNAIDQSKKEFEGGKGVVLTPEFFAPFLR